MKKASDGGPAFQAAELANIYHHGMTLRDYFAAKVLQGVVARAGDEINPENLKGLCTVMYTIADAMLAERLK
jgi:hypothetical protein